MGAREWLLLAALAALWGCSFLFVELALRDLPVFTVALGRTGIAAAFLLLLLAATRAPLLPLVQRWREFLLLGALRAAIPMSLIVWAQTRIDSGVAGILNSTSPLFTMVIAHLLTTDDRLTPQKLIGCLIGMVGVVAMIGMEFLSQLGDGVGGQLAMLWALRAATVSRPSMVAGLTPDRTRRPPPACCPAPRCSFSRSLLRSIAPGR
jgi:drug/metabolite transporter (DMT)-like permease